MVKNVDESSRNDAFCDKISTAIWQETPSAENPYTVNEDQVLAVNDNDSFHMNVLSNDVDDDGDDLEEESNEFDLKEDKAKLRIELAKTNSETRVSEFGQ